MQLCGLVYMNASVVNTCPAIRCVGQMCCCSSVFSSIVVFVHLFYICGSQKTALGCGICPQRVNWEACSHHGHTRAETCPCLPATKRLEKAGVDIYTSQGLNKPEKTKST